MTQPKNCPQDLLCIFSSLLCMSQVCINLHLHKHFRKPLISSVLVSRPWLINRTVPSREILSNDLSLLLANKSIINSWCHGRPVSRQHDKRRRQWTFENWSAAWLTASWPIYLLSAAGRRRQSLRMLPLLTSANEYWCVPGRKRLVQGWRGEREAKVKENLSFSFPMS